MIKKSLLHSAFVLIICFVSFITGFNAGFGRGIKRAWQGAEVPTDFQQHGSVIVTVGLPFAPTLWKCRQVNSTENSADVQCWEY